MSRVQGHLLVRSLIRLFRTPLRLFVRSLPSSWDRDLSLPIEWVDISQFLTVLTFTSFPRSSSFRVGQRSASFATERESIRSKHEAVAQSHQTIDPQRRRGQKRPQSRPQVSLLLARSVSAWIRSQSFCNSVDQSLFSYHSLHKQASYIPYHVTLLPDMNGVNGRCIGRVFFYVSTI